MEDSEERKKKLNFMLNVMLNVMLKVMLGNCVAPQAIWSITPFPGPVDQPLNKTLEPSVCSSRLLCKSPGTSFWGFFPASEEALCAGWRLL